MFIAGRAPRFLEMTSREVIVSLRKFARCIAGLSFRLWLGVGASLTMAGGANATITFGAGATSALPAFTCTANFYEVISGQLSVLDLTTGIYNPIGDLHPAYNGTGYNVNDNYIYGFGQEGSIDGHLIRVGSNGDIESLGDVGIRAARGTLDSNNRLFHKNNGAGTTLNFIDVTTQVTGTQTFIPEAGSGPFPSILDLAYVEKGGEEFVVGARDATLVIYNLTTSTSRTVTVPGLPSGSYGAAWGASNGSVFFSNNNSGTNYEILNIDGTPSIGASIAAAVSSQHDGMACAAAPPPFSSGPILTIEKVASQDTNVPVGSTVRYTYTVTNTGGGAFTDVTVSDSHGGAGALGTVSLVSFTNTNGSTDAGGDHDVDVLEPGDAATFQADYIVHPGDSGSTVSNTATANGMPSSGSFTPPTSMISITVGGPATPSIELVKSVSSVADTSGNGTFGDAGDTVNYAFTVANTGNTALAGVSVSDAGLSALTGVATFTPDAGFDGTLAVGEGPVTAATATYILAGDDLSAGNVTNTASSTSTAVATDISGDPDPSAPIPGIPAVTDTSDTGTEAAFDDSTGATTTITNPGAEDTDGTPGNDGDEPTVVTLPTLTPSIELIKSVSGIADTNGNGLFGDAGDTMNFTFTVANTGTTALAGVSVSDTGLTALSGAATLTADAGFDGTLAIGEGPVTAAAATYVLTPTDVAAGSVSNTATSTATAVATTASGDPDPSSPLVDGSGANLPPVTDMSDTGTEPGLDSTTGTTTPVVDPSATDTDGTPGNDGDEPTVVTLPTANPALDIEKSLLSTTQQFPLIYEFIYQIDVRNTGNVAHFNVQVQDDLAAALVPGVIRGTPTVTLASFAGAGGANAGFNGSTDTNILEPGVILPLGSVGRITLTVTVDFTNGFPSQGNTALAFSDSVPTPVASDAPNVTPGDPTDTNPTPQPLNDAEGDGSPDVNESSSSDRDGDGISDADDFDPTGYFYCQEDGRILAGGFITVTGPVGSQSGVGTSNNIIIDRDGSTGFYQFRVTAPGRYGLTYTLPTTGVASTNRLPGAPLDLTTLLPANPAVLGGTEVGATGVLSDFSAVGNPFHVEFDIEAGDPNVFANNIPLMNCSTPEISATKTVVGIPLLQGDGSYLVTYDVAAQNIGLIDIQNISLADDLNTAFGGAVFDVTSISMISAPVGFLANANGGFNGAGDQNVLLAGGDLQPGQTVTVRYTVQVRPTSTATYVNTVMAGGQSPLDGSAISEDNATASVALEVPESLVVSKTASTPVVRIGDVLSYTITITNTNNTDRTNVNIVDFVPAGFTYRPGTARMNGVAIEPSQSTRRLVWAGQTIPGNGSVTLTLSLGVGAGASGAEFTNQAWVEDPGTGARVSTIGRATVRREIEHVFDCGEIIGRVFDDKNRNGYPNKGEPGLAGVRVATVRGELITTDKHGRFHVPCAEAPDARIGSNFIMKLDTRTLPTGYRVTSENPRVVRLTRGKITKLNFGASIHRVVRIDLSDKAFARGEAAPGRRLVRGVETLVERMAAQEASVIRISFHARGGAELTRKRIQEVKQLIETEWSAHGGGYRLEIETRTITKR